jgi:hypothetical protein
LEQPGRVSGESRMPAVHARDFRTEKSITAAVRSGAIPVMTAPKNRLISDIGGLAAKCGEYIFRFPAGQLEVERIRAEIDLIAPHQFAG